MVGTERVTALLITGPDPAVPCKDMAKGVWMTTIDPQLPGLTTAGQPQQVT